MHEVHVTDMLGDRRSSICLRWILTHRCQRETVRRKANKGRLNLLTLTPSLSSCALPPKLRVLSLRNVIQKHPSRKPENTIIMAGVPPRSSRGGTSSRKCQEPQAHFALFGFLTHSGNPSRGHALRSACPRLEICFFLILGLSRGEWLDQTLVQSP